MKVIFLSVNWHQYYPGHFIEESVIPVWYFNFRYWNGAEKLIGDKWQDFLCCTKNSYK